MEYSKGPPVETDVETVTVPLAAPWQEGSVEFVVAVKGALPLTVIVSLKLMVGDVGLQIV